MTETRWAPNGKLDDEPDWEPLERFLVSLDLCAGFMWMNSDTLEDGTVLHCYKHRWTRRHLELSSDGRAFRWAAGERFVPVSRALALAMAFDGWEVSEPAAYERLALEMAIDRARVADQWDADQPDRDADRRG